MKMMRLITAILFFGCSVAAIGASDGNDVKNIKADANSMAVDITAAVQNAAKAQKHLFMFFYTSNDDKTVAAKTVFNPAIAKLASQADSVFIDKNSVAAKEVVEKYRLQNAPTPLVLVLAPNGAITGGFVADKLTEQQIIDALASSGAQQCLKSLQEGNLVFICAYNNKTKSNDAAMQGVNDFKQDARFSKFTQIVHVDPNDAAEAKFLSQLKINPKSEEAVTVFLAPPGAMIGTFNGATNKDKLVTLLTAAMSSGGGCGSGGGGCGPKGCSTR